MTGDTSDSFVASIEGPEGTNKENREDGRGLTGWIKNKYRETVEQRRNKSPPGDRGDRSTSLSASLLHGRGKSIDLKRGQQQQEEKQQPLPPAMPQTQPPAPPPPTQEPGTQQQQ